MSEGTGEGATQLLAEVNELRERVRGLDDILGQLGTVRGKLRELTATVEGHGAALDDIEELTRGLAEQAAHAHDTQQPPIDIEQLARWVRNNVTELVERRVKSDHAPHWCPQWWRHPEAVLKFEGLRRAWAELVPQEGLGLINYVSYLDQTIGTLTADAGPFHTGMCSPKTGHGEVKTLGGDPPPASA